MSRANRKTLLADLTQEVRGWQSDQEIFDSGVAERSFQILFIEVWITPRTRKTAHVGEDLDPERVQGRHEFTVAKGRIVQAHDLVLSPSVEQQPD